MLPVISTNRLLPDILNEFFGNDFLLNGVLDNVKSYNIPAVNISETKNEYCIDVAAPGLDKNDINVEVDEEKLIISAEKKRETEQKDENGKVLRSEFNYNSFRRIFNIPEGVNSSGIKASHKNGVLTIVLPKKEEKKQELRTIKIS